MAPVIFHVVYSGEVLTDMANFFLLFSMIMEFEQKACTSASPLPRLAASPPRRLAASPPRRLPASLLRHLPASRLPRLAAPALSPAGSRQERHESTLRPVFHRLSTWCSSPRA